MTESEAHQVAIELHELGLRNGECVAHARPSGTDHDYELHLPAARYIVDMPPVADPDLMEDAGRRDGDELVPLREQYRRQGSLL